MAEPPEMFKAGVSFGVDCASKVIADKDAEIARLREALRMLVSCDDWSRREEGCDTKVYYAAWAEARKALGYPAIGPEYRVLSTQEIA